MDKERLVRLAGLGGLFDREVRKKLRLVHASHRFGTMICCSDPILCKINVMDRGIVKVVLQSRQTNETAGQRELIPAHNNLSSQRVLVSTRRVGARC